MSQTSGDPTSGGKVHYKWPRLSRPTSAALLIENNVNIHDKPIFLGFGLTNVKIVHRRKGKEDGFVLYLRKR